MYTVNNRFSEYERIQGVGTYLAVPLSQDWEYPRYIESVYSWRTGKNAVSDPPVTGRSKRDGWGLTAPSERGNLFERLADRKRYIEELQKAAFPAETQTGSVSTNRVSKTDSGHLFATNKTLRSPARARMDYVNRTNPDTMYYHGDVVQSLAQVSGVISNPSGFDFGFATSQDVTNRIGVTSTQRQGMANRYFAATAPDRKIGSIGVTLVELLRGDIPSVLKNFQEMMAGYRSVKNYLGSEYLNIVFGWTPLIQEYANLIRVGMALERVVYYESFRRKRQWDGPSASGQLGSTLLMNNNTLPYGKYTLQKGVWPTGSGFGQQFGTEGRWIAREDYHFASRYTGLAKAGRRAESYSDMAQDILKRLGLVDDPTLLWDLTPYSWLVDWFSTMGESLTNAQTYSPVTGKYNVDFAYLTTQHTYHSQGQLTRPVAMGSEMKMTVTRPSFMLTSTTRWRDRATPFGFGTQLGSLNSAQFGILVALGLAQFR